MTDDRPDDERFRHGRVSQSLRLDLSGEPLLRERLDLKGNPSLKADWHSDKQGQVVDFLSFARSEGRFRRQFGRDGEPSPEILAAQEQVLRSWRLLQEIAGVAA